MLSSPKPAATLVIWSFKANGGEVFMLKRQNQSSFWPNAHVFPGGVVEESDFEQARALGSLEHAHALAAIRETHEECGLSFNLSDLTPIAWWLTPVTEKRRYDTRFFFAEAHMGQIPKVNLSESALGEWVQPAAILESFKRGDVKLAPPTFSILKSLYSLQNKQEIPTLFNRANECICPTTIDIKQPNDTSTGRQQVLTGTSSGR